jgi:hypothetical protein
MSRMVTVGRWTRFVLLGLVAATAVLLIVSTLVGGAQPDEAAPEPSAPVVPATPTPTPAAATSDPDRRFLAMDGGGVLWRGTAGSCADGVPPRVERTSDAVTWRNATPTDAAEVLALAPGDGLDQATVAIALDDGSCTPAARRTTPDGSAWQDDPAVPAADMRAPGALASTPDDADGRFVARRTDACDGVALAREIPGAEPESTWQVCEAALDPEAPLAIDYAAGRLYVWSGDVLTSLAVE